MEEQPTHREIAVNVICGSLGLVFCCIIFAAALVLMGGCANQGNPALSTPSALFTTHFSGAQPSQSDVDQCVTQGRATFGAAQASSWPDAAGVRAGTEYEACMRSRGFVAR